ncbi:ABC transporter permease, partial [Burkholderia cenocepacia]
MTTKTSTTGVAVAARAWRGVAPWLVPLA